MEIGSPQWKDIIRQGAQILGVNVSPDQTDRFCAHARELIKWNRKVNLTAITDPFEIAVKHFVDSIAAAPMLPPNTSLLDVGSGGGFPGIPLKVLIPTLKVTLVDRSRKKVGFLKHVCRMLQMEKIDARHSRVEDLLNTIGFQSNRTERPKAVPDATTPIASESFDVVISRAFSSLTDFVQLALPVLSKEGMIVALRGKVTPSEIESLRGHLSNDPVLASLGGGNLSLIVKKYKLPFIDAQRSLVALCRKSGSKSA